MTTVVCVRVRARVCVWVGVGGNALYTCNLYMPFLKQHGKEGLWVFFVYSYIMFNNFTINYITV